MKKTIAKELLKIKAVFLKPNEPFTWTSGIKSPIYCDNRLILTSPATRTIVENAIADKIRENYPACEVLMGTSTAGIAHAAIAGHILGLPMGYVRGSAKSHGRTKRIEGRLDPGQKVVIVEDLISTGGSVLDTVQALRDAGADVLGIISIFTYGMKKGTDRMAEAHIESIELSDFDTLVDVAACEGYIEPEEKEKLLKFRDNPSDESWMK